MNHHAGPRFWRSYRSLSPQLQRAADRAFEALKADASHPSLHFKKVGPGRWSARVTKQIRALAYEEGEDFVWYWIGPHDDYEGFIGGE